MKTILITGGTGLIGKFLTGLLQQEGFEVNCLSRNRNDGQPKTFYWNIAKQEVDADAITGADYIIHLAGANVAGHRWTKKYKQEIRVSREQGAALIYTALERNPNKVQAVISSSAIGYYGERGDKWLSEEEAPGTDFLGATCTQWEASVRKISRLNKRVVLLRTGIVLAKEGGALPPLVRPLHFGMAPIFGNGQQYYPWIHIYDLCQMYLHAIKNESLTGAYNATAPEPVRYIDFMNQLAETLGKRKMNVPVPMAVLQLVLGDFVKTLSMSIRCSAEKILATGFEFRYPKLESALINLLKQQAGKTVPELQ